MTVDFANVDYKLKFIYERVLPLLKLHQGKSPANSCFSTSDSLDSKKSFAAIDNVTIKKAKSKRVVAEVVKQYRPKQQLNQVNYDMVFKDY